MYETTVNQLVTVAVFPGVEMVLQSIQLAGYLFGVKYPFFLGSPLVRLHGSGTRDGHALFGSGA